MRPKLEEAERKIREAAKEALNTIAFDLASRAAQDAPIETGRLRGSVSPGGNPEDGGSPDAEIREVGDRIEVSVSFSTPYAAAQHEGYIDYGAGEEITVPEHTATIHGRTVRIPTYTYTRRGRVVFRNHPLGGGKKYLERNLKAMVPRYEKVLAAKIAEATRG